MASADVLTQLQRWYLDQCDGEWEHSFGVAIDTLDNPGWIVKVDLTDTRLTGQPCERNVVHRSEDDWVASWREGAQWQAACGPLNLEEALQRFLTWAAAE